MFAKSGKIPKGKKKTEGSLAGHLGKEECRGDSPAGVTLQQWHNKFRSVEDCLMKKLGRHYGDKKKAKKVLDSMRDSGWVRDKALDDLKVRTDAQKAKLKARAFVQEDLSKWED